MHAHIVLSHPEAKSYNAYLCAVAREALEATGWSVTATDLYQSGFDALERASHYRDRVQSQRFDVQLEQRHASDTGTIPPEVAAEIANLDRADFLILQYPLWWHLPPAILKGWMDRVLIYGEVYTSKMRFEDGRFKGKRAILSTTVGTSPATYAHDGRSGDIDLLCWPVNFTLAYVGYTVLQPFIAYGVEAGLRYSSPAEVEKRLEMNAKSWAHTLKTIDARPAIPFNRMSEWGSDGHIAAGAPVHSPFVRRKKELELE
ncbi:MAG: NAD(P)H-dependent oxidoreductase [Hyphomicrobiaceae bacterium]